MRQLIGSQANFKGYCPVCNPYNIVYFEDLKEAKRQSTLHLRIHGHSVRIEVEK